MVDNLKCVSAFSPFLLAVKGQRRYTLYSVEPLPGLYCVDIMTRASGNWNTRETGYINCIEKTGPDLFCQLHPQCLLKMAADRTSIAFVTSLGGCCANR